ncbi:hypothetical protein CDV36_013124 [Fusarium kuroshium]|uniref:Uncharacterized protein n=1 Tax=Fusarium kuroshium TaxID=2010991 RepID=A0A3M2RPR2_9HYPO|nr:hypothetical protein CDV36_013124 [Fusarium kuroshium]
MDRSIEGKPLEKQQTTKTTEQKGKRGPGLRSCPSFHRIIVCKGRSEVEIGIPSLLGLPISHLFPSTSLSSTFPPFLLTITPSHLPRSSGFAACHSHRTPPANLPEAVLPVGKVEGTSSE